MSVTATTIPFPPQRRELQRLFEAQRAHAPAMARTTAAQRRERLRRLRAAVLARRDAIVTALHADFGKPAFETELSEVHFVITEIDHAIRRLARWMRPVRAGFGWLQLGTSNRIHYEPRGVVLILGPFNYPFGLMLTPLIAAIAAGNCAILKSSEKVPHIDALMAELVADTCDPAEVAMVTGGVDLAQALLELPFDHFFFTGSSAVGRIVMAAAAKHLASVTLELGGKSPVVVDATADVRAAAERTIWARYYNGGQTCISPDYALVHASREGEFVAAACAAIARQFGATEEARAASPDLARLVDDGAFRRVRDLVERSVAAGARVEIGGRFDAATRYVAPTILTGVTPDMPVMGEEIFGPVLPVLTYRSLDEAIALIRAGDKPLAMYTFAGRAATDRLIAEAPAGATVAGNMLLHYGNPRLPFGGVGASGLGAYHGVHGFREFSHARAVVRQHEPALSPFFHPPYRGRRIALARWFLRFLER